MNSTGTAAYVTAYIILRGMVLQLLAISCSADTSRRYVIVYSDAALPQTHCTISSALLSSCCIHVAVPTSVQYNEYCSFAADSASFV
jgi:hypothetical protein